MIINAAIINWTGNRRNWGCQATSYGLLEDLREATNNPELSVFTVPLKRLDTADKIAAFFSNFLSNYFLDDAPSIGQRWLFRRLTESIYGSYINGLKHCNVAVFMAEGTMNGIGFMRGLRLLMLPYYVATELRIPVISCNQTIFSLNKKYEEMLRNVYRHFTFTAVREPASQAYAATIGLNDVSLIPDSAFRSRPREGKPADFLDGQPIAPLLCITGSGDDRGSFDSPAVHTLFRIAHERNLQPCVLYWRKTNQQKIRSLENRYKTLPILFPAEKIDYKALSTILSGAEALVGGRYHTSIQAAAVHTPFLALRCATHKTRGLLQMLEYPFAEHGFDEGITLEREVQRLLDTRSSVAEHLKQRMKTIEAMRKEGIASLHSVLSNLPITLKSGARAEKSTSLTRQD